MIMAVYANGEMVGKTAFVVLDCLWFAFTWRAYAMARRREFASHKNWMIRSYALTLSAIMLRTWKIILSHSLVIDPGSYIRFDAWMGFVPNLLVAEWMIRRKKMGKR